MVWSPRSQAEGTSEALSWARSRKLGGTGRSGWFGHGEFQESQDKVGEGYGGLRPGSGSGFVQVHWQAGNARISFTLFKDQPGCWEER